MDLFVSDRLLKVVERGNTDYKLKLPQYMVSHSTGTSYSSRWPVKAFIDCEFEINISCSYALPLVWKGPFCSVYNSPLERIAIRIP